MKKYDVILTEITLILMGGGVGVPASDVKFEISRELLMLRSLLLLSTMTHSLTIPANFFILKKIQQLSSLL